MNQRLHIINLSAWILAFFLSVPVFSAEKKVDLYVSSKTLNIAGCLKEAIVVNDQLPAPTLRFREGDNVTINVWNCLKVATSIHWHGILVPWYMDGVDNVTQKSIPPGGVFHYQFKIRQAGTYWYHAHTHLQEQEGLYGAFIIDPIKPPAYHYMKDYVIVLSDWSNTSAEQVYRNLKKTGEYYAPRFPLQASLARFHYDYAKAKSKEKKDVWQDYLSMQYTRMGIYDFSDVAYDAYLLNGRSCSDPWIASVTVDDTVRLRFIGAAASTIYKVKIPCAVMKMVNVQGHDVEPYDVLDFTIAPGETYDVLVKITKNNPYIIYAESSDTLGKAYGALVPCPLGPINFSVKPFPQPLNVMREMMANMMGHGGHSMSGMSNTDHIKVQHHMVGMSHTMKRMKGHMSTMKPTKPISGVEQVGNSGMAKMPEMGNNNMDHNMSMWDMVNMMLSGKQKIMSTTMTMGTKYQNMVSAIKTNDPNKPYCIINMALFGWMDSFIWFINGVPEYQAQPIVIEAGKRYRLIFTNASMMHHPMHIHGHFFILRNGNGAYDPLLHTIDVGPGANVVADFDADEVGQWFFHCHHLYHMVAGMSRVLQYETFFELGEKLDHCDKIRAFTPQKNYNSHYRPCIEAELIKHPQGHPAGFYKAFFIDFGEDPFNNVQRVNFKGLYGPDFNKLELFTEDAEVRKGKIESADIDVFYWHQISQFWALKGGLNYFNRPTKNPYWQPGIGIEGLAYFFIDTNIRVYNHCGTTKFDLIFSRDTQLAYNFFIRTEVRGIVATKTVEHDEIGSGLNQMRYVIRPYYCIKPGVAIFTEYEHEQAHGAFKRILASEGEDASTDSLTFGLMLIL